MTNPITGTNNALVTDVQGQAQSSGFITVFEIELPDSNIGGTGLDKLFFHDGRNGTSDITWYSLINESDFGSTTPSKYSQRTYTALPIESEGWEVRGSGSGSLPRPTVRFANVNQFFKAYLADWDDLVGAKVIRRRTLEKYLGTNPPVEFNRDVFYIERKSTETSVLVEFELTSAFDVEGIQLPRRTILAARCPWKYKDTEQGGCDWPNDNRYTIDGSEEILYFDKDDTRITLDAASPSATEYTYWGRQDDTSNRSSGLYKDDVDYAVDAYVEYPRPIGSLYSITKLERTAANEVELTFETAGDATQFTTGTGTTKTADDDYLVIKGVSTTSANHKNVPLRVSTDGGSGKVKVQTDDSHTATIGDASAVIGYVQACRPTLYRCTVAHKILQGDSIDDLIRPTNISYWKFGDVCGKRLSSCAKRFAHVPNSGKVDAVTISMTNGVLNQGDGYASAPSVSFTNASGDTTGSGAAATAVLSGDKVLKFTVTNGGSGYTKNPTVTVAAPSGSGTQVTALAEARVKFNTNDNVALPFGGFPGASFG